MENLQPDPNGLEVRKDLSSTDLYELLDCNSTNDEELTNFLDDVLTAGEVERHNVGLQDDYDNDSYNDSSSAAPSESCNEDFSDSGKAPEIKKKKSKSKGKEVLKKTYIAEASRKSRMKRKLEKQQMELQQLELEHEQQGFLSKIAYLQNEIQSLKTVRESHSVVDQETENRLLRAEVKRHRAFVNHIRNAIYSVPDYTKEERLRVTKLGIDSSIGQMLGLCYMSMVEPTWHKLQVPLPGDDGVCHVRFQYLPHGSTHTTAKRVNIRLDYPKVNQSPKKMIEDSWAMMSNTKAMEMLFSKLYSHVGEKIEIEFNRLPSFACDSNSNRECAEYIDEDNNRMELHTYKETFKSEKDEKLKTLESLISVACKVETVRSGMFAPGDVSSPSVSSHILSCSYCNEEHAPAFYESPPEPGIQRPVCNFFEMMLFRQVDNSPNDSIPTVMYSNPIDADSFGFCDPTYGLPLNEDGTPKEGFVEEVVFRFHMMKGVYDSYLGF